MVTHENKPVSAEKLIEAQKHVAEWWRNNAHAKHKGKFASHVTQESKDRYLGEDLLYADEIEEGKLNHNFTIWQRMNYYITGKSVSLLN